MFNTNNWKKVKTIAANDVGWSIISCDFSPNKQWLIYSSWSDSSMKRSISNLPIVHICNTSGEHQIHEALYMRYLHDLNRSQAFSPSDENRFCLFSIQFSPLSNEIVGGSNDRHIYVYDLEKKVRTSRVNKNFPLLTR